MSAFRELIECYDGLKQKPERAKARQERNDRLFKVTKTEWRGVEIVLDEATPPN